MHEVHAGFVKQIFIMCDVLLSNKAFFLRLRSYIQMSSKMLKTWTCKQTSSCLWGNWINHESPLCICIHFVGNSEAIQGGCRLERAAPCSAPRRGLAHAACFAAVIHLLASTLPAFQRSWRTGLLFSETRVAEVELYKWNYLAFKFWTGKGEKCFLSMISSTVCIRNSAVPSHSTLSLPCMRYYPTSFAIWSNYSK